MLGRNNQLSQKEKLAEVSRQFEAILLRQILGEAQKPVFQSKASGSSVAGDVYRDMVTTQMADQVSQSGAVGLARVLATQLQHQYKTDDNSESTPPGAAEEVPAQSPREKKV
jgi:Rod binding domain-containing protein